MAKDITLSISQKQKQTLSLSLAMAIKLTELTGNDILSYLQNEALDNPLIEIVVPETYNNYLADASTSSNYSSHDQYHPSATTVIESVYSRNTETLYDHLQEQLVMEKSLTNSMKAIVKYLISQLDDSGFLRIDLKNIQATYHIPVPMMDQAITLLQSFDPAGVGARTLSECYLLQLQRMNTPPTILMQLLKKYGEDLIHKQLSKISRETQIPSHELYDMLHYLHKLSPAPGKVFNADATICVYPDVFLTIEDSKPVLRYADENIPCLNFHQDTYIEYSLMDGDVRQFARQRYSHYKFIQRALAMRKRTLLAVSSFIANYQLDYFLDGAPLRPLTLKTIAHACHISISTASRTVKNKYMRTEQGLFPLGHFLSREFTVNGDEKVSLSVFQIKQMMTDIISKEDKEHPYSDYSLEKIFHSLEIPIARRTITKYRRAMHIPDSRYRKNAN